MFGLKERDPLIVPKRTITGRPQTEPESIGGFERRARLMWACVRLLAAESTAQPGAIGRPLGDGLGMEPLVEKIRPIFASERSMIRWTALRGALMFLDMAVPGEAQWRSLLLAMGLSVTTDPFDGRERIDLLQPDGPLTPDLQGAAIGLYGSLASRLEEYDQLKATSVQEVNSDPRWYVNEAMALDYIVWSSVALLRTGAIAGMRPLPEPSAFEGPGWYIEPLFAKGERYWDGNDWTPRIRNRINGRMAEGHLPLDSGLE